MRLLILPLIIAIPYLNSQPAQGAGMVTHALGAERSIPYLYSQDLKDILLDQRMALLSGGSYPDSGYTYGGYGEVSHWGRFINAYADHIHNKPDCQPLVERDGPCAAMIAHLMGAAAHGLMDETWDWLFEPLIPDHGEDFTHPLFRTATEFGLPDGTRVPPGSIITSPEYAMDMIAITDYYRWQELPYYAPPAEDLAQVYAGMGLGHSVTDVMGGHVAVTAVLSAERAGAAVDAPRIKTTMPWTSSHFYGESGGVIYSAQAIAGYLEHVWHRVKTGQQAQTEVVAVHPMPNERRVTTEWATDDESRTWAGPHGGGEQRIIAVVSDWIDGNSDFGTGFQLRDQSGKLIAPRAGFPKWGPYGGDAGTHSMLFYPASDLQPCTSYTASISRAILDSSGAPVRPYSWRFTTRSNDGSSCDLADAPVPQPEPQPEPEPEPEPDPLKPGRDTAPGLQKRN